MAVFQVNTDTIIQAVSVADKANQEITSAMNLLNQVAEHTDWECPERDLLIEKTRNNKAKIKEIQTKSDGFYHAISQAKDQFLETEKNCTTRSNQMDALISELQNIVPGLDSNVSVTDNISIADFSNVAGS